MSVASEYFQGNVMASDFFGLMCGEELGHGMSRHVFLLKTDPTLVVKFETNERCFQNVKEWEAWEGLRWGPLKKWMAPCVSISACGNVLIQKRTAPLRMSDLKKPHKAPAMFTDTKPSNWGILDGRLVCHDYGTLVLRFDLGLRKLKWNI